MADREGPEYDGAIRERVRSRIRASLMKRFSSSELDGKVEEIEREVFARGKRRMQEDPDELSSAEIDIYLLRFADDLCRKV